MNYEYRIDEITVLFKPEKRYAKIKLNDKTRIAVYDDETELNVLKVDVIERGSIYKADVFYRGEKIAFKRQIFDWWSHGRKFFVDPYTEELAVLISEDPYVELKVSWTSSKVAVRARDEKALENAARALAEFAKAYLIAERRNVIDLFFRGLSST